MKDNLIQFPVAKKARFSDYEADSEVLVEDLGTPPNELDALRSAFDEARKKWPLEMAELPEQNRKCADSVKR